MNRDKEALGYWGLSLNWSDVVYEEQHAVNGAYETVKVNQGVVCGA